VAVAVWRGRSPATPIWQSQIVVAGLRHHAAQPQRHGHSATRRHCGGGVATPLWQSQSGVATPPPRPQPQRHNREPTQSKTKRKSMRPIYLFGTSLEI